MGLQIFKEQTVRIPRRRLHSLFDRVIAGEITDLAADVHLVLTTDERLRDLNRDFCAKDRPTDVLSFNIDAAEETGGVFGEIYISVPTARQQAAGYGGTLAEELLRLTCHGLLHLCGYDHSRPDDAARMKQREDRYLTTG